MSWAAAAFGLVGDAGVARAAMRGAEGGIGAAMAKCALSLHGDTRVRTKAGLKPLKLIGSGGEQVWARNEHTGKMGWRTVVATHVNSYDETVTLVIRDVKSGALHTIVSNRVHPFYVGEQETVVRLVANGGPVPLAGTNAAGRWIEAQDLDIGDRFRNDDGSASELVAKTIEKTELSAYNGLGAQ
jgi:hypothetical protein